MRKISEENFRNYFYYLLDKSKLKPRTRTIHQVKKKYQS